MLIRVLRCTMCELEQNADEPLSFGVPPIAFWGEFRESKEVWVCVTDEYKADLCAVCSSKVRAFIEAGVDK